MTEDGEPEKGDVCVLNSGGPLMTIIAFHGDWAVTCSWMSDDNTYQEARFPVACVRIRKDAE